MQKYQLLHGDNFLLVVRLRNVTLCDRFKLVLRFSGSYSKKIWLMQSAGYFVGAYEQCLQGSTPCALSGEIFLSQHLPDAEKQLLRRASVISVRFRSAFAVV